MHELIYKTSPSYYIILTYCITLQRRVFSTTTAELSYGSAKNAKRLHATLSLGREYVLVNMCDIKSGGSSLVLISVTVMIRHLS